MMSNNISIRKYMEVEDKSTGRKAIFEVVNNALMNMYHPDTKELIYKIELSNEQATIEATHKSRTPSDAGKCMLECSRGCKGDFECVAGCALTCATIII